MTELTADTLVIGAGPGGYVCAIRLAQLGKKVVVAEKARAGGICLTLGCIPTKALLHAVHTVKLAREGSQIGLSFAEPQKDIAKLSVWRGRVVDRLVRGVEYLFKQYGVQVLAGAAEFTEPKLVRVIAQDGNATLVRADRVVIATGSEPTVLPGLEPDGAKVITSNEAVLLKQVPDRLLIVGAGAIGLEFASIYAGLGSKVTVVEIMDQVLPGSDTELSGMLERSLRKQGIQILLKTRVDKLDRGDSIRATFAQVASPDPQNPGTLEPVSFDSVLVAVGRRPLSKGMAIENSGVKLDKRGYIEVNEKLEASQTGIYAIGDVARMPLLAHKASREGVVVAECIAGMDSRLSLNTVPGCVYTDPEMASVGMTEVQAVAAGHEVAVGKFPLSALGRAVAMNRLEGMCKIVADAKTDKVLGVHILAPEASSLISEGTLAVELGLTARDIARTVHPHPSFGELMMEAAEAVYNEAIHLPPVR